MAKLPEPCMATTMAKTTRSNGNSQPPPWLLNTHPLPKCAQVAPSNIGKDKIDANRVYSPIMIAAPPTTSPNIVRYAIIAGKPILSKKPTVPGIVNTNIFNNPWDSKIIPRLNFNNNCA